MKYYHWLFAIGIIVSAVGFAGLLKDCHGGESCCMKSVDGNTICFEGPCPRRR